MLSLQLKSGEYLTIGEDIAVQVFEQSGSNFLVSVKAPREIPILRGEVLERTEGRPDGLLKKRPKSRSDQLRDARRMQMLAEKRERAEEERKQTAREQAAVTEELKNILSRMDEIVALFGQSGDLPKQLDSLRFRLEELSN